MEGLCYGFAAMRCGGRDSAPRLQRSQRSCDREPDQRSHQLISGRQQWAGKFRVFSNSWASARTGPSLRWAGVSSIEKRDHGVAVREWKRIHAPSPSVQLLMARTASLAACAASLQFSGSDGRARVWVWCAAGTQERARSKCVTRVPTKVGSWEIIVARRARIAGFVQRVIRCADPRGSLRSQRGHSEEPFTSRAHSLL